MTDLKFNIGIIGKNFGHKVIYESLKSIKNTNVLAFSSKKKSGKNFNRKIKILKNYKELIKNKSIDIVIIASPPKTHERIVKYCIKYKKNFFCEKPALFLSNKIEKFKKKLLKKKIYCMVNYEFDKIKAINYFKNNFLKKIKIKKVEIIWNIKTLNNNKSWKNEHKYGGGVYYNYICHVIFYIIKLFGDIGSFKINKNKSKSEKRLKIIFKLNKGFKVNLNFCHCIENKKAQPIHRISIFTSRKKYILESKTNKISDAFNLYEKTKNKKKILYLDKEKEKDFRIYPTKKNIKIFLDNIQKYKNQFGNIELAYKVNNLISKLEKKKSNSMYDKT